VNWPALQLWRGQTVHTRHAPFENRFAYDLVLIDIDIDRLDAAQSISAFFAVEKPALFAFYRKDHGPRTGGPLRPWAEDMFAAAGVLLGSGMIRLVTFPRHFLYKFAPISLWYGYGPDGDLRGIIYEVNNTFGDTHAYVAAASAGRNQHEADKALYVSPFFDVSGKYRFTLRAPGNLLDVVVESFTGERRLHMANIKARRCEATTGALLRFALTNPLSTLGVPFAIHWQALKLWLRGAGFRGRPAPPTAPVSVAKIFNASKELTTKDAA
jgi:uncharacterized protein